MNGFNPSDGFDVNAAANRLNGYLREHPTPAQPPVPPARKFTPASLARVERWFHEFISSNGMQSFTSERDSDFINEPERAERCYDAAEFGADGKTHAEVIEDWRDYVELVLNRRGHEYPERFAAAVHARIDAVEDWHDKHGTLHQEIG